MSSAWIAVGVIVACLVVGFVAAPGHTSYSPKRPTALTLDAGSDPGVWLDRVAAQFAALPRHRVTRISASTIQVARTGPGAARLIGAIMLFPIGLLLLIGSTLTATISIETINGVSRVTLAGKFSPSAHAVLDTALHASGR